MVEKYFFRGVDPTDKEYYTYILKGGPGTGKSGLMKKIAERFAKTEKVTCFYCSADPESLDGVRLHKSKVMIVDGTPPHVSEPQFPGVRQEIVDLGQFWDKSILNENREEIIKGIEQNKSMSDAAANYSKALGLICDDTYARAEGLVDRQGLKEAAESFCDSLLKGRKKRSVKGKQTVRHLSAMTKCGYMTMPDAAESCHRLFILDDELFAASSMFIDYIAARAMEYGFDIKLSPCILFGKPISEHLLIEEMDVALMTSNPLTQIVNEKADYIDCSRYYDKEQMKSHEKHFAKNHSLMNTLLDETREMLENVNRIHDEIEQYYTDAMDFDALDSLCEKICEEIE